MKVVLLNGPRNSGKDTIAIRYVRDCEPNAVILPFMLPIKLDAICATVKNKPEFVEGMNGSAEEAYKYFETVKDTPQRVLDGETPRQMYIRYGEQLRKDKGQNVIADLWITAAAKLYAEKGKPLVVPDVRLQQEVNAAICLAGTRNVFLAMITRPGTSWEGDIGSWLDHDWSGQLINTFPIEETGKALARLIEKVNPDHKFITGGVAKARIAK